MEMQVDIRESILAQFARQLGLEIEDGQIEMDTPMGKGRMKLRSFPNSLELYHFRFEVQFPVHMRSFNPADSEWLLLNINLSKANFEKTVNDQVVNIQRFLPSGILLYTPHTQVSSTSPPGQAYEIALIRFHRSFLSQYLEGSISALDNAGRAIIYEDLDFESERLLQTSLSPRSSPMEAHASLLGFMSLFLEKLKAREKENYRDLHPADLKGLFLAAAHLRNPLSQERPSVEELAGIAGMGATKFKTTFKQVFGRPPLQYRLQIKMEYARKQLAAKLKSPSELSYELGYSHPSKFTQAYKKQFGESPSGR